MVCVVDDGSGGFEEAPLGGVRGGGGIVGPSRFRNAASRAWAGMQDDVDVEVDVEADGGGQGIGPEGLDDLGEAQSRRRPNDSRSRVSISEANRISGSQRR